MNEDNNAQNFKKLIESRRSVRKFTQEKIPDEVSLDVLESALLAPNSSNLQSWEFVRVINPEIKKHLALACFSQSAAETASDLIVCLARTDKVNEHCKLLLKEYELRKLPLPKIVKKYYTKLAPFAYFIGPFGLFSPFKWALINLIGLFKVVPREPIWPTDLKLWAVKSCALACEHIMLAYKSYGYDTCPMEGYDSSRVRKILKLSRAQHLVMIIAAGKAAENGIYGPQIRFSSQKFIKTIL